MPPADPLPAIRLTLLARADAPELLTGIRASRSLHHPWIAPPRDQAGFDALWADQTTGASQTLIARDGATDAIAGVFTLSQIVLRSFQSAYLSYYAIAGQEGRGRMSAGLCATLDHAFGALELHRVEANIQPDNPRSIALVRRAGFRKEGYSPRYLKIDGIWRDHERWALLCDDPRPRP